MLGIIGGTGLAKMANLTVIRHQIVRTPYGEPSAPLIFGDVGGREVVFLARHGGGHTISPDLVNYRANMWALRAEGVTDVIAVATVGGIHADLVPGRLVLPDQIIDYTYGRKNSFHGEEKQSVQHIDFTEPYSSKMRDQVKMAAEKAREPLIDGGVYAAVQGPRLETAAEVNRLERDGATMVGMTGMPEAALAKELGLRYAALCPVVNHAAGRGTCRHAIDYAAIGAIVDKVIPRVEALLENIVVLHGD